jgi:DNA-binding PadR family transcriptional regulator
LGMPHNDVASSRGSSGPKVMPRGLLQFIILRLLHERPCAGAEVSSEIFARSRGAWRPSPGSLYPAIGLLRQKGLISEIEAAGGVKRYVLTDPGRTVLGAHMDELSLHPPWLDLLSTFAASGLETRPGSGDLWEAWRQMIQSVALVADVVSVDPGLARRAREILEGAATALCGLTPSRDRVGVPIPDAVPSAGPSASSGTTSGVSPSQVEVPVAQPETAVSTPPRS